MATYADTLETPKQESGILSRMFNALTPKFLKDYISEIKQELKAVDREREWHRQDSIDRLISYALENSSDKETQEQYIKDFLKLNENSKESNFFDFGKIDFQEVSNKMNALSDKEKEALVRPSETATFEA